jgi:hypothetical protein
VSNVVSSNKKFNPEIEPYEYVISTIFSKPQTIRIPGFRKITGTAIEKTGHLFGSTAHFALNSPGNFVGSTLSFVGTGIQSTGNLVYRL